MAFPIRHVICACDAGTAPRPFEALAVRSLLNTGLPSVSTAIVLGPPTIGSFQRVPLVSRSSPSTARRRAVSITISQSSRCSRRRAGSATCAGAREKNDGDDECVLLAFLMTIQNAAAFGYRVFYCSSTPKRKRLAI